MIDDDVITRLVDLHDHLRAPDASVAADVSRGQRALRRRRAAAACVAAAAVGAIVLSAPLIMGTSQGRKVDKLQPAPASTPPEAPASPATVSLERIRAEGRVDGEQVMPADLTVRTYVLCDGTPECSPDMDGPIRRQHEQRAIEVTQGNRSSLFRIGNSDMTVVTNYADDTVLVMDPLPEAIDYFQPTQNSFRLVRADGTEIPLRYESTPAPAVPGPGVVLIKHYEVKPDNDSMASQIVLVADDTDRTVRLLDLPPDLDSRRTWGPNLEENLWLVTFDCKVRHRTEGGVFETRRLGCASTFDPGNLTDDGNGFSTDPYGNPGNGDVTWVNEEWFPDRWLTPQRMAFLERDFVGRNERRLTLHVTLDGAATWQRIPVSDEAAIPGELSRLG